MIGNSLVCIFFVQLIFVAYYLISYKYIKQYFRKLIFLMITSLIVLFDAFFEFTTMIKSAMYQISMASGMVSFDMIKKGVEDVIFYESSYLIIIFFNVLIALIILFYKGRHQK